MNAPKNTILILILGGESIFFLPFVLARIFRPTLLEVLHISNVELGSYFSIYGLVALVSYFFGGPLADKYNARGLMSLALILTAIGGFVMSTFPEAKTLYLLYAFWGFTTIFLFWSALIKATRVWGGPLQGKAFGLLEGGRGAAAALIGTSAIVIFSWLMPEENVPNFEELRKISFQWVVIFTSVLTAVAGVLSWFLIPKDGKTAKTQNIDFSIVKRVARKPEVWLQGLIIVAAYVGYKITDDISLYAHEVLGYTEVESAKFGTAALWLRPIFAILVGFLVDKFSGSKIVAWCFSLMIIGGSALYLNLFSGLSIFIFITFFATLAGVYGIRGAYFTLVGEAKIPLKQTGTAVGLISVLGFTPDIFISPLMGYLLDQNPGVMGHRLVFLTLALFSILGLIAVIAFRFKLKKTPL